MGDVKKMQTYGMFLILCGCALFFHDAQASECEIFISVLVGLVVSCWDLDILIQALPDSLFRSARSFGESFTINYLIRLLNICKALDMFCWRFTDARGAIRQYKNTLKLCMLPVSSGKRCFLCSSTEGPLHL